MSRFFSNLSSLLGGSGSVSEPADQGELVDTTLHSAQDVLPLTLTPPHPPPPPLAGAPATGTPAHGFNDPALAQVATVTGAASRDLCLRCKQSPPLCMGLATCVFESNCFVATRELPCVLCNEPTLKGVHLITKMKRGPANGKFVHRLCAQVFYEANPAANVNQPEAAAELRFSVPPSDVKAFIDSFIAGEAPLYHLGGTAGCGKSNQIIYAASRCRAEGLSFRVLVYGVKAKEELLARGLRPDECINFHAFFMRAYRTWVIANLTEHLRMQDVQSKQRVAVYPTVCQIKVRLVLSFHLRETDGGPALVRLLRSFVTELCNQARTHAFGASGPMSFDKEGLTKLVTKYHMAPHVDPS